MSHTSKILCLSAVLCGMLLAGECAALVRGDANGDGVVNNADINPLTLALVDYDAWFNTYVPTADPLALDMNFDGFVDNDDINFFEVILFGRYISGDANGDGVVNPGDRNPFPFALVDYDAWYNSFVPPAVPIALDTNQDGFINNLDIAAFWCIMACPSHSTPAVAVPEPTSCILLFSSVSFVTIDYRSKRDKSKSR